MTLQRVALAMVMLTGAVAPALAQSLVDGQAIAASLTATGPTASTHRATPAADRISFAPKRREDDENGPLQVSGYAGLAIDSFAATDLRKYLNPKDAEGTTERHIVGIDFDYRLAQSQSKRVGLYVYGETVNGVRSADVDCKANPETTVCTDFSAAIPSQTNALFALRNASSLEAFAGARLHFARLNGSDDNYSAELYVKAGYGFLTVAGSGGDLVDTNQIAIGLMVDGEAFRDSYLEVGFGRTDLFSVNQRKRLKLDAFLSMKVSETGDFRPFLQMTVDSDRRSGPDSVQIYLGVDFNLNKLFKKD